MSPRCRHSLVALTRSSVAASQRSDRSSQDAAVRGLIGRVEERRDGAGVGHRRAALLDVLSGLKIPRAELEAWSDGVDVVGTAYERLLSGAERRDAGQFQTPFFAADVMAAWLLQEPTQLLLDPGVGSGRLLFRAGIRDDAPKRLLGLDVDEVACAMARLNLRVRGLAQRSSVKHADFLLDELKVRPDAVICNPPYSRHHSIPVARKAEIHDRLQRSAGFRLSRLTSLHAMFLVRALDVVADDGRVAFITPADWLDVGYGQRVKQYVLANAEVEAIILFPSGELPFGSDVMSSAAITLMRKRPAANRPSCDLDDTSSCATRMVMLAGNALAVDDVMSAVGGGGGDRELRTVERRLKADEKWGRMAPGARARHARKGRLLAEVARVRRGIATGANSFFVISERTRKERRLFKRDLRPCIASPRLVEGLDVTAASLAAWPETVPRWVLNCRRPNVDHKDTALGRYLQEGRVRGVADGYLASRRKPWYALEERGECPIVFTYFNRGAPRAIRNRASAVPLNTFLIVEPVDGLDSDELWLALNSEATRANMKAAARDYAGMWKLEPRELASILIEI